MYIYIYIFIHIYIYIYITHTHIYIYMHKLTHLSGQDRKMYRIVEQGVVCLQSLRCFFLAYIWYVYIFTHLHIYVYVHMYILTLTHLSGQGRKINLIIEQGVVCGHSLRSLFLGARAGTLLHIAHHCRTFVHLSSFLEPSKNSCDAAGCSVCCSMRCSVCCGVCCWVLIIKTMMNN